MLDRSQFLADIKRAVLVHFTVESGAENVMVLDHDILSCLCIGNQNCAKLCPFNLEALGATHSGCHV